MSIVSCTRPPRVTTSSATMHGSPGSSVKRRITSAPSFFSAKMHFLSSARATSCPTRMPPSAGETTVVASRTAASGSRPASAEHSASALRGQRSRFAHWKNSGLWSPERSSKWPRSSAPVSRRVSRTSSEVMGGISERVGFENAPHSIGNPLRAQERAFRSPA